MIPGTFQRYSKALALLPSTLLVTIAIIHFFLVYTYDLSPWFGGGFGMFSTSYAEMSRHLHIFAITPTTEMELMIPKELRNLALRARALPTHTNMRRLAQAMSEVTVNQGSTIRVELWSTTYHNETMKPNSHLLREFLLEAKIESR